MNFAVNFNRNTNSRTNEILEELGATPKWSNGNEEFLGYFIDIKDFKELKEIMIKVNKLGESEYYAVIDIVDEYPAIYFDDEV